MHWSGRTARLARPAARCSHAHRSGADRCSVGLVCHPPALPSMRRTDPPSLAATKCVGNVAPAGPCWHRWRSARWIGLCGPTWQTCQTQSRGHVPASGQCTTRQISSEQFTSCQVPSARLLTRQRHGPLQFGRILGNRDVLLQVLPRHTIESKWFVRPLHHLDYSLKGHKAEQRLRNSP